MNNQLLKSFVIAAVYVYLFTSTGVQAAKQMPPDFSLDKSPDKVLREYPLGVINEQEAFAHHGGPVRKVVLPNGNRGWLYKTGETEGVPSVYVLQLSRDGIVIDVLHKDVHYKIGHSALQYQYLSDTNIELKTLGPAPGK